MTYNSTCRIWGPDFPASSRIPIGSGMFLIRDSPRAGGGYQLEDVVENRIGNGPAYDSLKARLTTWLIDQRQLGVEYPAISNKVFDEVKRMPRLSVNERANRFLQFLVESTDSVSDAIDAFVQAPEALAWSESTNRGEIDYFLSFLHEMGWLQREPPGA